MTDYEFDRVTLSPRFIEKTVKSRDGIAYNMEKEVIGRYDKSSFTSRKLEYDDGYGTRFSGGTNVNGVSFISALDKGQQGLYLHESLHGIFSRNNGQFNPWLDYKIFKMSKFWLDPSKRFYERILNGF